MSRFVFTPELTKEDAQRIVDALMFLSEKREYNCQIKECAEKIRNKDLITRLRKIAKLNVE